MLGLFRKKEPKPLTPERLLEKMQENPTKFMKSNDLSFDLKFETLWREKESFGKPGFMVARKSDGNPITDIKQRRANLNKWFANNVEDAGIQEMNFNGKNTREDTIPYLIPHATNSKGVEIFLQTLFDGCIQETEGWGTEKQKSDAKQARDFKLVGLKQNEEQPGELISLKADFRKKLQALQPKLEFWAGRQTFPFAHGMPKSPRHSIPKSPRHSTPKSPRLLDNAVADIRVYKNQFLDNLQSLVESNHANLFDKMSNVIDSMVRDVEKMKSCDTKRSLEQFQNFEDYLIPTLRKVWASDEQTIGEKLKRNGMQFNSGCIANINEPIKAETKKNLISL